MNEKKKYLIRIYEVLPERDCGACGGRGYHVIEDRDEWLEPKTATCNSCKGSGQIQEYEWVNDKDAEDYLSRCLEAFKQVRTLEKELQAIERELHAIGKEYNDGSNAEG